MTTPIQEQYQEVFRAPGGKEVLADLTRYVQRLPESQRGPAALVVMRITQMLMTEHGPARLHVRGIPASGGRIAHGS